MTDIANTPANAPAGAPATDAPAGRILPDMTQPANILAHIEARAYDEATATVDLIDDFIKIGETGEKEGHNADAATTYKAARVASEMGYGQGPNAIAMAKGAIARTSLRIKKLKAGQEYRTAKEERAVNNAESALSYLRTKVKATLAQRAQDAEEKIVRKAAAENALAEGLEFDAVAERVQQAVSAHRKAIADKAAADKATADAGKPKKGGQPGNDNASKIGKPGEGALPEGAFMLPAVKVETLGAAEAFCVQIGDKLANFINAQGELLTGERGTIMRDMFSDLSRHVKALRALDEAEEIARNVAAKEAADKAAEKPAPRPRTARG